MRRLAAIILLGFVVLLAAGLVAAYGDSGATRTVSPRELSDAGWFCLDPGYWVHCTPPGIDISKKPPVIVSLNFWTKDPKAAGARYLGFEDLIRVDIWKKTRRHWPCGSGTYRRVPGNSLPKPGYMYCHHFNDKIALPTR
jgi:hypothetical protein